MLARSLLSIFGAALAAETRDDERQLHDTDLINEYNHCTSRLDAGNDPYGFCNVGADPGLSQAADAGVSRQHSLEIHKRRRLRSHSAGSPHERRAPSTSLRSASAPSFGLTS